MATHLNRPSSVYKGFKYIYEDRFLGHIRIKPVKRKFWGEVRRIRRSVSKRLWERADYRQAISIGVRNSWRDSEMRRKCTKVMKKTATAAALKKVALEADSKYEPLKRWPARISTTGFTIVVEWDGGFTDEEIPVEWVAVKI